MSIPDSLRELAKIDAELTVYWREREAFDARGALLRTRRNEAIDQRLAEITDEQILTDENIRAWAVEHHDTHTGIYKRVRRLAAPTIPEISVHGVDGREGYENHLRPTVILERDSDIAVVAVELRLWAVVWGMGRADIPIDILDSSLSHSGSYAISWKPGQNAALLRNGFGEIFAGRLYDTLVYVAEHYPYNHGRDGDE